MSRRIGLSALGLVVFLILGFVSHAGAVPLRVPVGGEIERIVITTPADHWSGGYIVVGGQTVIIPRNLLMDLPANRLTLKELFDQAPAACLTTGETGLAKGDVCNTTGTGGFATISANRTNNGDVIAGDVFIEKGKEALIGTVTYVNYTDGYFKVNGDALGVSGTMVRLNDPDGRHTIQLGSGCAPGSLVNCSPDPRFTLDADNYTNTFVTGYPVCLPSTFVGGARTVGANPVTGAGDEFCPRTNRDPNPLPLVPEVPVANSTRFAPILVGDSISAEGNFETINGVRFLSVHTTMVQKAMTTINGQPDYLFLDEVEMDVAGFQNQRARTLIIGYATRVVPATGGADVLFWTLHYDPTNNAVHEFPLASVVGCDNADAPGTCGAQGIVGAGLNIFKIRHDVDFIVGADPKLNPCDHLRAETRFGNPTAFCGAGDQVLNITDMFAILSPIPREIQARTGQKLATPGLVVQDILGNEATWGQYLFPFGFNLGGLAEPEWNEIDLDKTASPFIFEGIPWLLDRRLSPGGCNGPCEETAQPLVPFPVSGLDPRTQALPDPVLGGGTPTGAYNDRNFTQTQLSNVSNRILSYVDGTIGKFNGNTTVLPLTLAADPPAQNPPAFAPVLLTCTQGSTNQAPVALDDATATLGIPINVVANDTDPDGTLDLASMAIQRDALNGITVNNGDGTISYTPSLGFVGKDSFTYTVRDNLGTESNEATVVVDVVAVAGNVPPSAVNNNASTGMNTPVVIDVLANDSDSDGTLVPASVAIVGPANGSALLNPATGEVTYVPNPNFVGADIFLYTVRDDQNALSNAATVNVSITGVTGEVINVTLAEFRAATSQWKLRGTSSIPGPGNVVTFRVGPDSTGPIIGSAVANAAGKFKLTIKGSIVVPDGTGFISVQSSNGTLKLDVPLTPLP